MAQITLNKNLATEFVIGVDSFNEDISQNIISVTKNYVLDPSVEPPVIPELPSREVTTLEVKSDSGVVLPITGTYNKVLNYNATYYEAGNLYSVHLTIGYEA